jgi:hypothetical protein
VILRERVTVADVGVLDAVQEHVHAPDAEHGVVEIESVEKLMVKMLAELRIAQRGAMIPAQILASRDEKAGRAASGIAKHVRRLRSDQFDHQRDDVPRGAELSILPRRGDFSEHVFVEVALGIAILHRHMVDHVHHAREQRGIWDGEPRVLHVMRIRGIIPAQRPQKRKYVLADDREHFTRLEMLEMRPAEILVAPLPRVLAQGKHPALHRTFEPVRLRLLQRVEIVQPLDEEQVGNLLDHLQRIGNATRPERVPDGVDLIANCTGQHGTRSIVAPRRLSEKKAGSRAWQMQDTRLLLSSLPCRRALCQPKKTGTTSSPNESDDQRADSGQGGITIRLTAGDKATKGHARARVFSAVCEAWPQFSGMSSGIALFPWRRSVIHRNLPYISDWWPGRASHVRAAPTPF